MNFICLSYCYRHSRGADNAKDILNEIIFTQRKARKIVHEWRIAAHSLEDGTTHTQVIILIISSCKMLIRYTIQTMKFGIDTKFHNHNYNGLAMRCIDLTPRPQ